MFRRHRHAPEAHTSTDKAVAESVELGKQLSPLVDRLVTHSDALRIEIKHLQRLAELGARRGEGGGHGSR
jgi:hypothetical protein